MFDYICSEPTMPLHDEYTAVLNFAFDQDNKSLMTMGVQKALALLERQVYPAPTLKEFAFFLSHTRPIGISNRNELVCTACNFRLDEFSRFDWITADFDDNHRINQTSRDEFLGFVARLTLYKLIRYHWDNHGHDFKSG